jgi:hypothetical protein
METVTAYHDRLIATRIEGDRWKLVPEYQDDFVYPSLTETLEAWFGKTGERVSFKLAPMDSKLFAILEVEEEIKPEPVKKYNLYGDPL